MLENMIITTILLAVFLCLRGIFDGKISARLQYGLWLLIALRLLLAWMPLPESRISLMNFLPVVQESLQNLHQNASEDTNGKPEADVEQDAVQRENGALSQEEIAAKNTAVMQDAGEEQENGGQQKNGAIQPEQGKPLGSESVQKQNGAAASLSFVLNRIYVIGVVLVLLWIIARNLWFWNGLRRRRIRYEGPLPVSSLPGKLYLVEHLKSPFLFGKHIYVSPEMLGEQQKLHHILVHESCHWKQGDSFWAVLRFLCLALYWYHPLVWCAVHFSIVDAELACDERAIRVLGEDDRHGYGDTLLGLIRQQGAFWKCSCVSTQMSGNKKETKKRLERIAERRKETRGRILFLVLSMLILCLATLPGGKRKSDAAAEREWQRVEQEGFPCIVVDEQGNVVGTKRGELLRKVILDYENAYPEDAEQDTYTYQIQADAFSACPNLKTIIIPNRNIYDYVQDYIDYIDPDAFRGCSEDLVVYCHKKSYAWSRLQELGITVKEALDEDWHILEEDTAALKRIQKKIDAEQNDSALTDQEMRQFYGEPFFMMTESGKVSPAICESLDHELHRKIYLPDDANILAGTFSNCLMPEQSMEIPKNIVAIESGTFQSCQFSGVTFETGSSLQSIGRGAFMDTGLTEVQLPDGLQEIGEQAFDMCHNLTEVTIPESVNTIGSHCFRLCDALERVVILNPDVVFGEEDVFDDEILDPSLGEGEIDMNDLDSNFIPNNKLTIVCPKGSTAEKYAEEHGLQVEYLQNE